mmetsp:Transcript_46567/g.96912  ORF Transcript_46567/g.96912 Transcript_46567/m.96912 type:complete len:127 (-) Transcript_46567:1055-1435(-)
MYLHSTTLLILENTRTQLLEKRAGCYLHCCALQIDQSQPAHVPLRISQSYYEESRGAACFQIQKSDFRTACHVSQLCTESESPANQRRTYLTLQVLREDENGPVMKREEPSPAGPRGETRTTKSVK